MTRKITPESALNILLADDSPRFVHAVTYRTAPKASANVLAIEIKETR